jgi:hypothetical protein
MISGLSKKLPSLMLYALVCAFFNFPAFAQGEHKRVHAPAAGQQIAVYEVYTGGVNVLRATVHFDITTDQRYSVAMDAGLKGFLARLVPWKGTFDSEGWIVSPTDFRPRLHRSAAIWQGDEERKDYHYTRAGGFQNLVVTENGKTRQEKTDPALTRGTTDALSAALGVFQKVAAGQECSGSAEVFDGKRRFKQVFKDQGTEELTQSKYNRFQGKAQKCTLEVVPAGGEWHKKPRGWMSIQEQGRAAGTLPTLWLARLNNTGPAVPVKIMLKTSYGTLFLHLAEYTDHAKMKPAKTNHEKTKKP